MSTKIWISLREPQRKAVEDIERYLSGFKNKKTKGAALVQMATGSGKTGIIATVAHLLPTVGGVLILAPSTALRDQLYRKVKGEFFEKLEKGPEEFKKTVERLIDGNSSITVGKNSIFIMTIQMFVSIKNNHKPSFEKLKKNISLIMVDEGHCEPAPTWSEAVRAIPKPKVIFTATPFRNDLKQFSVDTGYTSSYSYMSGVSDKFLMEVKTVKRIETSDPKKFIDDILAFVKKEKLTCKVIIRCASKHSIEILSHALSRKNQSFIAIHERFNDQEGPKWQRKSVPENIKDFKETFWLHQYKLIEGIDCSDFQVLAIFEPFQSIRELVQQVGRITRIPDGSKKQHSFLLDHHGGKTIEAWGEFLRYDQLIMRGEFLLATGNDFFKQILSSQPKILYTHGRFRFPIKLTKSDSPKIENFQPENDLRFSQTANIYQTDSHFTISKALKAVQTEMESEDKFVISYKVTSEISVLVYIDYSVSKILRSHCFVENKLGISLFYKNNKHLIFYDSNGRQLHDFEKIDIKKPPTANTLNKLFKKTSQSNLSQIWLKNTDSHPNAIISRSFKAKSVSAISPEISDIHEICTRTKGWFISGETSKKVQQYIGFQTGRVTHSTSVKWDLYEYIDWANKILQTISSRAKPISLFNRYAKETPPPSNTAVKGILLDVSKFSDEFQTVSTQGSISIDTLFAEVTNSKFEITAEDVKCSSEISYNNGKYTISSSALDTLYETTEQSTDISFVDKINREECFSLILNDRKHAYVDGRFYRPNLNFGNDFNLDSFYLDQAIITSNHLGSDNLTIEKGREIRWNNWVENCLFGIISRLGNECPTLKKHFGKPDILVCDDTTKAELADFILCEKNKKVIFIHAKMSTFVKEKNKHKKHKYGAGYLADVCTQACKNLSYLSWYGNQLPKNYFKWEEPWNMSGLTLKNRIRINKQKLSVDEIKSVIETTIKNPTAEREVWIFLGRILSKKALIDELRKEKPSIEALHTVNVLQSNLSNASKMGVRFKIFCHP